MVAIRLFLFASYLLVSVYSFGQQRSATHRDSLERLKAAIREHNTVASPWVGNGGVPSRPWHSFALLALLATKDELLEMIGDQSAAVRLYGYLGLVYRHYGDSIPVKTVLLNDTARLFTIEGCLGEELEVREAVLLLSKWHDPIYTFRVITILQNNPAERTKLYSAILSHQHIKRYSYY